MGLLHLPQISFIIKIKSKNESTNIQLRRNHHIIHSIQSIFPCTGRKNKYYYQYPFCEYFVWIYGIYGDSSAKKNEKINFYL